jgi:hypothetical protein
MNMKKLLLTAAVMFALAIPAAAQVPNRYEAEELGLTVTQYSLLVESGQMLGLSSWQMKSGLHNLVAGLRNIKIHGSDSYEWRILYRKVLSLDVLEFNVTRSPAF